MSESVLQEIFNFEKHKQDAILEYVKVQPLYESYSVATEKYSIEKITLIYLVLAEDSCQPCKLKRAAAGSFGALRFSGS